jgi:addiction module HigA family antidote
MAVFPPADKPGAVVFTGILSGGPRLAPHNTAARTPPHPGLFLDSRFLKPLGITQDALARGLGVSRRRVNELVRGRRAISADTAIRLGLFFRTGPEFWMNLQQAWDMYQAWRAWRRGEAPAD